MDDEEEGGAKKKRRVQIPTPEEEMMLAMQVDRQGDALPERWAARYKDDISGAPLDEEAVRKGEEEETGRGGVVRKEVREEGRGGKEEERRRRIKRRSATAVTAHGALQLCTSAPTQTAPPSARARLSITRAASL